jgi:hypothetical protein
VSQKKAERGSISLVELQRTVDELRKHSQPLPIGAMIDAPAGRVTFLYRDGHKETRRMNVPVDKKRDVRYGSMILPAPPSAKMRQFAKRLNAILRPPAGEVKE